MNARALLVACALAGTAACAGRIQTPPLPTHRLSNAELELRLGGFEHTHMGLKQLQLLKVYVDRIAQPWRVQLVSLARNDTQACSSGIAALLLDTSAGRTGDGSIVVAGPTMLDAGFSADEAEDICDDPCRLDILFEDHQQQPRCVTMQLTR